MILAPILVKPREAYQESLGTIPIYISTEMPSSKDQAQDSLIIQAQKIVQSQRLIMSEDPRMVGNKAGFSLFQMMNEMDRKIDEQKQKLDKQIQQVENLNKQRYLNRIVDLANQSTQSYLYEEDRQKRNARVHGANIELDLQALAWVQENDKYKFKAAQKGFEVIYGLPFSEGNSFISAAPDEVIEFMNKRSDLNFLEFYLYSSHSTQEISDMEQICTDIINLWEESRRQNAAYPEDKIRAKISEYERLHGIWEEEEGRKTSSKKRKLDAVI